MRVLLVMGLVAFGLAGAACSSDEDEAALEEEALTAQDLAPTRGVPVQAVRSIEIGRTRDGIVITAFGTAPALGYALPRLRARRGGQAGQDGFLDFDFVADPPRPGLERPQGIIQARSLRADALLREQTLRGVTGVRVHALNGGVQAAF